MTDQMKGKREGGFLISKIHQLSQRIFAKLLKEYNIEGLNPAQGRIMFVLWQKDKIPIHELVKQTQLTKSTLTSTLDRLEQAGFLKRVPSEEDRREILIELNDIGKNLKRLTHHHSLSPLHFKKSGSAPLIILIRCPPSAFYRKRDSR